MAIIRFSYAKIRIQQRKNRGSQIAEFGAALALLAFAVILPVVDFSIVPVRWMMAQETIKAYSRELSFCESFSQASKILQQEPSLESRLNSLGGVQTKDLSLKLRIASVYHPSDILLIDAPAAIPKEWLPDGAKAPCTYSVLLEVKLLLYPAFPGAMKGNPLPGLTGPFPVLASASHEWENLGRNPNTGKYYLNE